MKSVYKDPEHEFEAFIIEDDKPFGSIPEDYDEQLRPIQLIMKPDGAIDDGPCYAIVLRDSNNKRYIAQITKRMLDDGLNSINQYKLKKV